MTFQTFTGKEYLKIDIASNYGLDKKSWGERIAWFNKNEHQLHSLLPYAAEPALFYAGVKAWEDVQAGRPTGYMISLDATSSGLQLLAALTGDTFAASLCNVVDMGDRKDAYTEVYAAMLEKIQDTAKISREDTKDAIMTSLYGSTAQPKRVFGEGRLLDVFYYTMQQLAPAAWELNQAFLAMWRPDVLSHDWVLPDNFHVHIKVMDNVSDTVHFLNKPYDIYYKVNQPKSSGRSLGANAIHSIDGMVVREMIRRCDYDPDMVQRVRDAIRLPRKTDHFSEDAQMVKTLWNHYKQSGYLSARILDHLNDRTIALVKPAPIIELLDSLPKKPFKVISIHDCFRCSPNYGNDLRYQYNLQLALIAKSELLSYIVSQIVDRPVTLRKLNPNLHEHVRDTNYALS